MQPVGTPSCSCTSRAVCGPVSCSPFSGQTCASMFPSLTSQCIGRFRMPDRNETTARRPSCRCSRLPSVSVRTERSRSPLTSYLCCVAGVSRRTQTLAAGATWAQTIELREPGKAGAVAIPNDFVFTNETGKPYRVDGYRMALTRAIEAKDPAIQAWKEMGSKGPKPRVALHAHPHQMRHTYATHLLEAGVPIHHVAELLGDAVATVEATYSHVMRPKHEVTSIVAGLIG
jgi:hypothetical protein